MNSEQLGYRDNSVDNIIVFFLLHEIPTATRHNTLRECLRILCPGGALIIAEYPALPDTRTLYRLPLSRYLLTRLEPFLAGFCRDDRAGLLNDQGWHWPTAQLATTI